jgi:hypothetical protein
MKASKRNLLWAALLGGTLLSWGPAMADDHPRDRGDAGPRDVHVGVHEGHGDVHVGVRAGRGDVHFRAVDRFHRVPPDMRGRAFHGSVHVRVTPFHNFRGWRVTRFNAAQRAMWTHGHWWHGRHNGRAGWWWWANGGWFWYDAPIYPYPGYVSDYEYDEPSQDSGDYWYYCRDPEGYYPYVQHCNRAWEPVPAQPEGMNGPGYGPGDQYDDQGPGPGDEDMGPGDQGPPDEGGPYDQGPPDEQGPPDDQDYPDDQGPPPPPHG